MAELTPVSKINYNTFKNLYNSNLPYNEQSQGILQKFDQNTFNQYSNIANQEKNLGFFDKLGSGLADLFAAQGAEPDYVNPNLAEMLAQQNYQNTLAYSPMFDNRNRFKEDIIPERMIDAPMDLESIMAGSILDKGITNRSLIGDLPNLNYRDYLSNLFNRNQTTQPDFINAPQDDYASLYSTQLPYSGVGDMGYTTPRTIADQNRVLGQTFTEPKKSNGIFDLLMNIVMPGYNFIKNLGNGQPYERYTPGGTIRDGIYSIDGVNVPVSSFGGDFYNPNTGLNRFDRAAQRFTKTGSMADLFASSRTGKEFFEKRRQIQTQKQKALEDAAKAKRQFKQDTGGGSGGGRDNTGGDIGSKGAADRFSNTSGKGRTGY